MDLPNDFKELLELFNNHKVEYFVANRRAIGRTKETANIDALGED